MIRYEKDVARSSLARKIQAFATNKPPQFTRKFFAAKFRQGNCALVSLKRRSKVHRLSVAQLMIKMAEPAPTKGCNRNSLLQLSEKTAGRPLHSGVSGRAAGIGYIDK